MLRIWVADTGASILAINVLTTEVVFLVLLWRLRCPPSLRNPVQMFLGGDCAFSHDVLSTAGVSAAREKTTNRKEGTISSRRHGNPPVTAAEGCDRAQ